MFTGIKYTDEGGSEMRWSGEKVGEKKEGGRKGEREGAGEREREKGERAREGFLQHGFSKWQPHRLHGSVCVGFGISCLAKSILW